MFPLILVIGIVLLTIRHNIIAFLANQGQNEVLVSIYPILTYQFALVLVLSMFFSIVLAYQLSRVLARPLNQLIITFDKVKKGDFTARSDVWARDEIGQVQADFNDLTANLEHSHNMLLTYNRELSAVNELAEAVTLGMGVDVVLETSLKKAISLMGVDFGLMYLVEKNGIDLKLIAQQGIISDEAAKSLAMVDQTHSLLNSLIETGHAVAVGDLGSVDAYSSILPSLDVVSNSERLSTDRISTAGIDKDMFSLLVREGVLSWACAPLKLEGELIGVFHLGKRSTRVFSAQDLAMLEIIGNVVGSSLSNAQLLKDLRFKESELRRALHRAVELQEEERKRLVRELHDEVGQALTSILIRLKTLQEEEDIAVVKNRLSDLRALTAQTIEELRRLSMDLRPSALDSLGFVPSLRWYIQQCAERTGLDISFLGPERFERLTPEIELTLYRVAQEGLTNAIRHGRAKKIVVFFERDMTLNVVRLTISDDGAGFNVTAFNRGLGLVGIRERIELLNGIFNIETDPGAGTQLWIEVPLKR